MKVGLPQELTHMEWVLNLKIRLNHLVPDIEWIHAPVGKGPQPLFLGEDACYPFKKMVRTSLSLLHDVDVLLLPRLVRLDGFLMCPNFRALPDIVTINKKRIKQNTKVPIVTPLMEVCDAKQFETLARATAGDLSEGSNLHYSPGFSDKKPDERNQCHRDLSHSIALIGHPYVLGDPKLNNGVPEILHANDFDTILAQEVPFQELDRLAGSSDYYAKKMYWRPGREILGAFLYFTHIRRPAGIIQLIAFNCGVEALLRIELMSLYRRMENAPPYMVIVCDEHTQRDHVVTRIEAFMDIVHGFRID